MQFSKKLTDNEKGKEYPQNEPHPTPAGWDLSEDRTQLIGSVARRSR